GCVVRLAAECCLLGRLADVPGRIEVRFAQAEVEDLDARRPELTGLGSRGYRGRRLNGRGQLRNADHGAFDLGKGFAIILCTWPTSSSGTRPPSEVRRPTSRGSGTTSPAVATT